MSRAARARDHCDLSLRRNGVEIQIFALYLAASAEPMNDFCSYRHKRCFVITNYLAKRLADALCASNARHLTG